MLHLRTPTDPAWAPWALTRMDDILLDHAHCEKKAASTAINLIFRYPERALMMVPLSRLAREELAHFELVLEHIERRGRRFLRQRPSAYAPRLLEVVRNCEPHRLLDTLLCCSMIEARSCERMQLLAEALEADGHDPKLAQLYRGLLASEARHHTMYIDLVRKLQLADEAQLRARLDAIADHESAVLRDAGAHARMHAGVPC